MTKNDALELAKRLASIRPDRGNTYATRTTRTKGAAAFAQWQLTCRTLAYMVCVNTHALTEAEFYKACEYD
jgi:hypothetical protein